MRRNRRLRRRHLDRLGLPVTLWGDRDRPLQRHLVGHDVVIGQQSEQLLEGALSPGRCVEWVLDRPEGIVGDTQHGREAALRGQFLEQLQQGQEGG